MRFNAVVVACLLLFVGVTGCNSGDQQDPSVVSTPMVVHKNKKGKKPKAAAPTATASASPGKAKTASAPANTATTSAGKAKTTPAKASAAAQGGLKPTLAKLNGYLPAAVRALQANDVATAKTYAQNFQANWQQKIIQFSVKNTSQAAYNKIAAGVTQVNNNLIKPANPDKAKAIAALQSLSQAVQDYSTGS
ncbi:MAG TPA: hypothetical protein V6C85_10060 [Allocoleopsis sp.]